MRLFAKRQRAPQALQPWEIQVSAESERLAMLAHHGGNWTEWFPQPHAEGLDCVRAVTTCPLQANGADQEGPVIMRLEIQAETGEAAARFAAKVFTLAVGRFPVEGD